MNDLRPPIPDLLGQALDLPEAERPAFLVDACQGDDSLRQRVERLLSAHPKAADLLESPALAVAATIDPSAPSIVGTQIGPYKLLEQIGEGGMGLVYMAEQQRPVRRLVALKLVKPGMDSKQVIARFEAERQALAMMDHPNIAKILDAGTVGGAEVGSQKSEVRDTTGPLTSDLRPPTSAAGRPFFVMELVRGIPINEFASQQKLTVRQRLELFMQVCQAIQHAHQKGIIHRDLKPTNVLVTKADTVPLPKVIDFGIAKALGPALTDHTLHTGFAQLVGTPLYMSPEQAEMNHFGVDTRSDVYSLGVLLYELLTGTTPFDKETLHKAGFEEMRRIIREDEPETVSARLAKTKSSRQAPRDVAGGLLSRSERATVSELDWIVMKALEKDRSRRYESAAAFAADIQRYLSDEPVLACPPTAMYRFQKFARKHKPALVTAAAVALCLILGTTVSAWQAVRATTAEAQADANAQQADEKAKEATQERDEAQKQRDEVKALADKLAVKEQQLERTLYAAHMNLAHNAFDAGAPARLRELLAQHRPRPGETDLRGFEWHYLNRLFPPDPLVLEPSSIAGMFTSVAYSPDGKRLATTTRGGKLIVWDAQTGKLSFSKPAEIWATATFSPDGKRIFALPKMWDAQTGQEVLSLSAGAEFPHGSGFGAAFTPDGKRLATSNDSQDGRIAIWDAQTGKRLITLEGHPPHLRGLAFSPDGKRLASAGSDKTVKLWDAESGQILHTLVGHTEAVFAVAYSPDGKRVASASMDKTVKLWDPQSGDEIHTLRGHTGVVFGVAFSPDGKRLASASFDTKVKVWDVESGDELFALGGNPAAVYCVAFSPDGQRLAIGGIAGIVKVREAKAPQKSLVLGGGAADVTQVAFSPDGKRLTSVEYSEAKVWDARTGEKLLSINVGGEVAALSQDGRRLAVGRSRRGPENWTMDADIWDLGTGDKVVTIASHFGPFGYGINLGAINFRLCPDGSRLFANIQGDTKMWDTKTGQEIRSLEGIAMSKTFSPDGKRVAGIAEDKTVKLWDAQTGDELLTLQGAAGRVTFSHDGKRLISGSADATVAKVWDAQRGDELILLKGHSGVITRAVFSPDAKRLATTSSDATIKVWDTQTGQELLTLAGHSFRDNGVAFSPDGNRLAAGGPGGTVLIYDATPVAEKP